MHAHARTHARHYHAQAAYLIGAGAKSYFACSDGWTVTAGWEPKDRWAEYDYPLGEPTGPALRRLRTAVRPGAGWAVGGGGGVENECGGPIRTKLLKREWDNACDLGIGTRRNFGWQGMHILEQRQGHW